MENAPSTAVDQDTANKLKEVKELVDHVYALKLKSDIAEKEYNAAKNRLAEIMEKAEIEKMAGDECNASLNLKNSVSFPKEPSEKLQLLEYVIERDNEAVDMVEKQVILEGALDGLKKFFKHCPTAARMLAFNPQSFNSWYNAEIEAQAKAGNFEVEIPTVKPYEYYSVGLRKKATRKKK